ncbi:multicopper oxidase family protein [Hoyosella altamirensis]|uniref:FtsP/CotA-like multicopper oxidase with cupredoxin domain n=1 Tax=Hoyosella altamirensis TaxID=616997 RepID=A0A839RI01_9ACTN|nr:multicopper oxidase domain-containing protein [Hoyosella altamirensis]MBB3036007.1 FtsP/CotA-like multicopper oxidase with cupredoxin domain [Hoyosella altamirensis]
MKRIGPLILAVLFTLSGCGIFAGTDYTGRVSFDRPLPIPPLQEGTVDDQGRREFTLTAREGSSQLVNGMTTPTWGFNGDYLGPTLRAAPGERVRVNVTNELGEATSVHWHGMHLPAAMDGGPHQEVQPGGTWQPEWEINQPPATLWYHPHPHEATEKHVYRGLAGLFLIDEPTQHLPSEYGIDDIPLIVQDKRFTETGELVFDHSSAVGTLGESILANGIEGAYLDATTEKVRLRLLNASTARILTFAFEDEREFAQIATDGGLMEAPNSTRQLTLSPGERAEIVVELTPGEEVNLQSHPTPGYLLGAGSGLSDSFDILQIRAADRLSPSPALPAELSDIDWLRASDAVRQRPMRLSNRSINGSEMDMSRIDEVVTAGSTEIWTVSAADGYPHNFHIHDVQFHVLDIDGEPPGPHLRGWKDTILLEPHKEHRLIMRFSNYADPDVPYMYHCHLLWHEDEGMMGQFVVVDEGQPPGSPSGSHHH